MSSEPSKLQSSSKPMPQAITRDTMRQDCGKIRTSWTSRKKAEKYDKDIEAATGTFDAETSAVKADLNKWAKAFSRTSSKALVYPSPMRLFQSKNDSDKDDESGAGSLSGAIP